MIKLKPFNQDSLLFDVVTSAMDFVISRFRYKSKLIFYPLIIPCLIVLFIDNIVIAHLSYVRILWFIYFSDTNHLIIIGIIALMWSLSLFINYMQAFIIKFNAGWRFGTRKLMC